MSHHKELADDAEDIPSDFFDDFNKEEFMEGLSVIDSWDDDGGKPRGSRINAEAIDSVRDLRELIGDGREEDRSDKSYKKRASRDRYGSGSKNLDDYIKPGSRRDPSKTNEAIKRDKQVKVKEYLAKKIEGGDDLRPPGTELDDYMDDSKLMEKKHTTGERSQSRRSVEKQQRRESAEKPRRESPLKPKRRKISRSPRRSPKRSPRHSPRRSPRRSPVRKRVRPSGFRRSRSPRRFSPPRYDRYERRERSRSPRRERSRSPRRDRSRSPRLDRYGRRSPGYRDSFLYPNDPQPFPGYHSDPYGPQPDMFPGPIMEYPGGAPPGYPFQPASFSGGFPGPYEFGPQPIPQEMLPPAPLPVPQPVPAPMSVPGPMMVPEPVPIAVPPLSSISLPSSAPSRVSPAPGPKLNKDQKTPFDALAQLVAEGKLSQEDYLKLAPNKSKSARFVDVSSSVETKARVEVLNRCSTAMSKLANLRVPSHLVINLSMLGPEPKALHPKYCSPLKRQATTEFFFTTPSATAAAAHNRQLIDGVISAVGLTNVVARPKKKTPKNMKDAACQTTKPYCDVCEIREATRCYDTATSIDPEHFSSTVHTQVLEQDLLSSKAMFTPSGSIGEGAPMSIAHLTPAQLVSQLAARAKTLKQSEPSPPAGQFGRRPPNYDYDNRDYDSRGGQQYQNYNNNYNRY